MRKILYYYVHEEVQPPFIKDAKSGMGMNVKNCKSFPYNYEEINFKTNHKISVTNTIQFFYFACYLLEIPNFAFLSAWAWIIQMSADDNGKEKMCSVTKKSSFENNMTK